MAISTLAPNTPDPPPVVIPEVNSFKVLVIGDLGAGKTSLIGRYVHGVFSSNYKSTIGVDFALKSVHHSPWQNVRIQLWDIAGQERFSSMTRVYYKGAQGAFVVFDVTRPATLEDAKVWKADLDAKVGSIPVILIGNKADALNDPHSAPPPTLHEMETICHECGFIGWYFTSAKENTNVQEAAHHLVENLLNQNSAFPHHQSMSEFSTSETVRLQPTEKSRSSCC